ncbi:glycosyltransferase [Piscinibacter sp.]|uniref:glycosyltransferase n=1 Tax=Piscinibacter sp. TaxID=1903157 RepID=UPI002ED355A5
MPPLNQRPALAVLSTLFPSAPEPVAGIFIKERMFRVARHLPVTVISPQPWFPLLSLVRRFRPNYRPERARFEQMDGIEVHRPRFFALPGVGRQFDAFAIALAVRGLLGRLKREGRADILDVHFGYPDGYAGHLLAKWLKLPYLITVRGKEERLSRQPPLRERMQRALRGAHRVISVSSSLRDVAMGLGAAPEQAIFVGNGIDLDKFYPVPRDGARRSLGIPDDAQVLVSVGGIGERKGFHRVIECLPALVKAHPKLLLLIVGGPSPEGDWTERLRQQVDALGLQSHVRFLGPLPPDGLRVPLSASDLFVLATSYEGWANVFLEAMACRLPVVSTLVGGNAEVVCRGDLGILVPFGEPAALQDAIARALSMTWDRDAIRRHAEENTWDQRVEMLLRIFRAVDEEARAAPVSAGAAAAK